MSTSGGTSSSSRSTTHSGVFAPPMMIRSIEANRSAVRPGSCTIRCSIVGTMMQRVIRCRWIRSTASAASNFSITTARAPSSSCGAANWNPFTWYSGDVTSTAPVSSLPMNLAW